MRTPTNISRKNWMDPIHKIWLVPGKEGLFGSNFKDAKCGGNAA
jgi:hypothetical protein